MNIKRLALWLLVIGVSSFVLAAIFSIATGNGIQLAGNTRFDIRNPGSFISGIFDDLRNMGNFNFNFDLKDSGERYSETVDDLRTFDAQGITIINVKTISTNVNFIPTADNEIRFHFHGDVTTSNRDAIPYLVVDASSNKLTAEMKHKPNISSNYFSSNLKLDVYIPEADFDRINVSTVSGRLYFEKITANDFYFNSVSGDMNGDILLTNESEFKTTSGGIKVNKFTGDVDFTSVSGDLGLNFYNSERNRMDLSTTSGKIKISKFNGDVKVKSVSGDITVDYDVFKDYRITMNTTSGSVNIVLPQESEFNVSISTTSGKINCDFPVTLKGQISPRKLEGAVGNGGSDISINTVSGNISITK